MGGAALGFPRLSRRIRLSPLGGFVTCLPRAGSVGSCPRPLPWPGPPSLSRGHNRHRAVPSCQLCSLHPVLSSLSLFPQHQPPFSLGQPHRDLEPPGQGEGREDVAALRPAGLARAVLVARPAQIRAGRVVRAHPCGPEYALGCSACTGSRAWPAQCAQSRPPLTALLGAEPARRPAEASSQAARPPCAVAWGGCSLWAPLHLLSGAARPVGVV